MLDSSPVPQVRTVVVEDHDALRDELQALLQQQGFECRAAACGQDLDDLLHAGYLPELLVLDLNLPDGDGIGLAQRLRNVYPQMGLVMLTGRALASERTRGYQSGADIYLVKPVSGDELLAALGSLVRRMRQATAGRQWTLDLAADTLTSPAGRTAILQPQDSLLLARLALAGPQGVVMAHELLAALSGGRVLHDKGYLEVLLSRMRKKLQDLAPESDRRVIRAVRGKGYRLEIALQVRRS